MAIIASEFWHIRHKCGHPVYWNNLLFAWEARLSDCPWCGGPTGVKAPSTCKVVHDEKHGLLGFRNLLENGEVPWPHDEPLPTEEVIVRHANDGSCCNH